MKKKKVIIMGAGGKDFHVFNTAFKNRGEYEVMAFTAASQVPGIAGRTYPARLAGNMYPDGIPIEPEEDLVGLIRSHRIDEVVMCYSDVSYEHVLECEQMCQEAGAEFKLSPDEQVMIPSTKHVVAITGVRTGSGVSAMARKIVEMLRSKGRRVAIVHHPMPYGDIQRQEFQRFESLEDLDRHECTIEEREEYEQHIEKGTLVFSGVDYCRILLEAEMEADVLVWDGGNNDIPFYRPDIYICMADPLRAGAERDYYPGKINFSNAGVIVINKADSARAEQIDEVKASAKELNPNARVVVTRMPYTVDKPELIQGKRVLVVEDGPTLTHGNMRFGAGMLAARKFGAASIVNPRPHAVGSIAEMLDAWEIDSLLPATGYNAAQIADLAKTIAAVPCDAIVVGTPINLGAVFPIAKPVARVSYDIEEVDAGSLRKMLQDF